MTIQSDYQQTQYQHIVLDQNQVAWIEDANMKVIELVLDHKAYGWSPEEIRRQHPSLSLGQIHSALAYYWDHQTTLDVEIQARLAQVNKRRKHTPSAPLQDRLHRENARRQS
jgi:uncharacterized protein (DUF433 family)